MTNDLHELAAGYALDALEDDELRAFEEHLVSCAVCEGELPSLHDAAAARRADAKALAIVAAPGSVRFPLYGATGALVVARGGEAALVVSGLRPAPEGKTYEVWVVRSGPPQPAGIFAGGSGRLVVALE